VAADRTALKHESRRHRLLHVDRAYEKWEDEFGRTLASLGVRVEPTEGARSHARPHRGTERGDTQFSMTALQRLAQQNRLRIEDLTSRGGRLWIHGAAPSGDAAEQLEAWGFRWAGSKGAWYQVSPR
jgi:hypothetical protein